MDANMDGETKEPVPFTICVESSLETCKGDYSVTSTVHNGRPVWKKSADPKRLIFYSTESKTWFVNDELEDEGFDRSITYTDLPLGLQWTKGLVLTAKHDEQQERVKDPSGAPIPPCIVVTEGSLEGCRGEYNRTDTTHNEHPVWKKIGPPERLLFFSTSDKTWYISDELEDQGFDKATSDVALPLRLQWLKGSTLKAQPGEAPPHQPNASDKDAPAPPDAIFADGGPESCAGEYRLKPTLHNGRPVWRSSDPGRYMFFSREATSWHIAPDLDEQPIDHAAGDDALPVGLTWAGGVKLLTGDEKQAKEASIAAALAMVRDVIAEIRKLRSQEGSEGDALVIKEATVRLAELIRSAQAAGASEDALLQASAPPATKATSRWQKGQRVEIAGLASEQGKQLNGMVGAIVGYSEGTARFQVELDQEKKVVSVKDANLRSPDPQPGDRVEVFGLESESGSKLNGREGTVVEYLADKERYKLELAAGEFVSVKSANIRRISVVGETTAQANGSASSSSSSETKKKRKKAEKSAMFSAEPAKKKRKDMNPDELMEKLLGKLDPTAPKKPKAPDVDPADSAAAAARAAGAAAAVAAAAAARMAEPLKPGDTVEVCGLKSEAGKALNGKTGVITKFDEAKGRFLVELGQKNIQSLKPDSLRRASGASSGASSGFESCYQGPTAGYTML